jgi:hypothetical protein
MRRVTPAVWHGAEYEALQDGCEQSKSFDTKGAAKQWLDTEITAKVATGTYVPPRAGVLTVAEVYTSWSASQGHISAKTAATRKSAWGSRVEPHWGTIGPT